MTYPQVTTKRAVSKELTRSILTRTARRLFAQHGYEGVGIRDIAVAATRSTGSFFLIWPSKEAAWRDVMGCEPPTAESFARFVQSAQSLAQASHGAEIFLRHLRGADKAHGACWNGVKT